MKTVNIHVKWAAGHPGQDRRLRGVVTHSRLQRATSVRTGVGIVLEDGSGVAIDWVTGRSYSSARRRLNAQSGQRKGRKGAAAPPIRALPSVIVDTEKVLREADGPVESRSTKKPASGGKVFAPGCASKAGRVSQWGARRSQAPSELKGRTIFMSMFDDSVWRSKDSETECIANSTLVSLFAKKTPSRTMVTPRTWTRKEVVFYLH